MTRFCHLIDDTTPGGVMRMLDFIQASPRMAALGAHDIVTTPAGFSRLPKIEADVIVSHIVLSWKNLPFFVALRLRHRHATLAHIEHHYSSAFAEAEVTNKGRFRTMLRASMALFDRVVSISGAQMRWLREDVGIAESAMSLIPSCVALDAFLTIAPAELPIKRIGAIGRLHPQKGFDILIPAFRAAALPGVVLDVFGDGPDRDKLHALAEGDPNIVFHGHVDDPIEALSAVDAVAMPSRREPYGLVALEAMAAGRPLLVSTADGLLDHAELGAMSVDSLSIDDWARALQGLCAVPDQARTLAARAHVAQAEDRFADGWTELLSMTRAAGTKVA